MNNHLQNTGFLLIENMLCMSISIVISAFCIHYIFFITETYIKIQEKFTIQNAKLITRHLISTDLYAANYGVSTCNISDDNTCNNLVTLEIFKLIKNQSIKPLSNILVLHNNSEKIVYYLRKSAVPITNAKKSYALYRDNIELNAQSIVENVIDFTIEIIQLNLSQNMVKVMVVLADTKPLEIKCIISTKLGML